jgi:predicted nucleic acid-binding protein
MNKILIDTNILIYAYDSQSAFHQRAVAILSKSENELYVTTKNIAEFFAVLTKLSEPYQKISEFYESIKSNSILLYPDHNSLVIFENLVRKYQPVGNRVFDIEIVSIA